MEDLGPESYILEIEIYHNGMDRTLTISQTTYVKNLLDNYQMTDFQPVSMPMILNSRLQEASEEDKHEFQELNIDYRQAIGIKHWQAFENLLQYLKGTTSLVLTLGGDSSNLRTFSDADYANCKDTRKSIMGYMTMIGNSCINWTGKKQSMILTSSCEAEYKTQLESGKDLIWTEILLQDLKISITYPLQLNGDNQGAVALA
ncbi:hypothetical protein O181_007469 [Austropuccinia psidii MF-1]|uniref:Reverse transcriptase Ty1/copia-type domain-containing protein n=1 Tax=Austropuccinia psidii MF-1 TaxID=1389203 RepID=A0A9Q3GHX3_9BASI|nr:hypothetical protein [Austropuccinia psidii MF-1]